MEYTFKDKVVIVTGGANGIGRCIADEFRSQGAVVYVIDKQEGEHFVGDISQKEVLEAFASDVLSKHEKVDIIINNALPQVKGIDECPHETNLFTDVSCCSAMIMSFIKPLLKKYKITSTEDLRDNQYVRMLCKIESDGRYPLIEYLCSEYENAPLELAELFTELKDFKALSCVMQHKK